MSDTLLRYICISVVYGGLAIVTIYPLILSILTDPDRIKRRKKVLKTKKKLAAQAS